jgi:signal transduction histidine kinase
MHTELDEQTGSLLVVPQNLGRVLLNLFNNAFYAVSDKEKKLAASPAKLVADDPVNKYFPTVWLSTKKLADKIEIRVKDNGMGIPPKILDNIFQPFFTSKPAGHGTGLGLSLSYQIVTKVHNGQIMVHSKEGEYAEFIIELPLGA